MGLDVYLHRYNNFEETMRKEKEYSEYTKKLWEGLDYNSLNQEQKDEISEKEYRFAESLGLNKWGDDKNNKESIEINSKLYPGHLFKVGYFRSSYNEGGINKILRNLGLPDMYKIMGVGEEEIYHFQPDWEKSIIRINDVIENLKKLGSYRSRHVMGNMFQPEKGPTSELEALNIFMEEKKKNSSLFEDGYSNVNGEFYFTKPLKIVGLIPGFYKLIREQPCTYVITEESNDWYIQALEIMKETCEYVLSQPDINQYYLHWSG